MLKHLPLNTIKQITELANRSLRDCYLPIAWKTAQVTMIHKKDDKSDPNRVPVTQKCIEGQGFTIFWYRSIDLGTLILMVPLKAHNSAIWGS